MGSQPPATAPTTLRLEADGTEVAAAGWDGGALPLRAQVEGPPGCRAWLAWTASGVPRTAPPAGDHGLRLRRRWLAEDGGALPARLAPGDLVRVELTVEADQALPHVVVVDPLPAAFAVENPRLDGSAAGADAAGGTVDVRDDRVVVVGALRAHGDGFRLQAGYLARVIAAGEMVVPPAQAECMYDAGRWSRTAAGRLCTW
ncbi:MAG: hypothetical protein L6R48_25280 [Planctomycetes bacterium]|nr:hypothetical protein [Planctomycetota bacterium]